MGALRKLVETIKENHQERAAEAPGEAKAIVREAIKDIRGTIHQVFFGQSEHQPEPGTPLNPTQQMVTREIDGRDSGGMER